MPLRDRAKLLRAQFNKGVSYISGDIGDKLLDAQNMLIIQNKLQTRPGFLKFNTALFDQAAQSLSFYAKDDGTTRYLVAKCGTSLKVSQTDGVFSDVSTALTATTKHDAVTMNGRHILAIGSDGLYSYDGTNFVALGIAAPTAPTAVIAGGGALSQPKDYVIGITYVCSGTGFETNVSTASATCTTSGGNQTISVSAIPVSTNPLVTDIYVYIKNTTDSGSYLFSTSVANGVTTASITANPASTADHPPTGSDEPLAGGAKYLSIYNSQIVAAGNETFPSDVFFSNTDEPDGWSLENTLVHAQGEGPITGLAVGYYQGATDLNQYLVIFKKRSTTIYFQSIGDPTLDSQTIINGVGCVSHKTIRVKDGDIYFLSDYGWRVISNAKIQKKNLANGDVDDIFSVNGFVYGVNKTQMQNSFATYYSELNSYMCWVPEGSDQTFSKCYNYHVDLDQFMPLVFGNATCVVTGEDADGNERVYVGCADKNIYDYSIRNASHDDTTTEGFNVDIDVLDEDLIQAESTSSIPIFAFPNWFPSEDYDATYNFRDLEIETIGSSTEALGEVTIKAFLNFNRSTFYEYGYNFLGESGFVLDVSMLDIDILGDDRTRVRMFKDINRTGRNILLGIYQDVEDSKLQLLSYQLNFNKNGNRNIG